MRIAVLASGFGSNLQALIDQLHAPPEVPIEIGLVLSDRPKAYALERARKAGIPTAIVRFRDYSDRRAFDAAIAEQIERHGCELIVLAGFMRILGPEFVRRYAGRVLNIHPSLLPAFPGTHGIRDALEYGVKVTGVTVHFVEEEVDAGPVIAQVPVFVDPEDTEETLAEKIHAQEHRIYPQVVLAVAEGRVRVEGRRVFVEPEEIR
ncbi:MAG: phosphoribosylglycinamide formyltransferase [Candidatus Poribacteria bacterium]|nr:MAG: phosphoribosylglycinamide formyltransferase [Candidatus Poribacteria bacterium]